MDETEKARMKFYAITKLWINCQFSETTAFDFADRVLE